ncbi:hypothetical protein [Megasphaera cerevisiae]|jgi:hypothetical protein|uniref:hypothetical protein n=1 Tax=Megasphaera cerevisiae TaxID=39029 RepID=UPI0009C67860|nr:hypothetical protein [Megasphaera cerevisiae]SJZ78443.1 hypothetical protein SAMN05660900_01450 [Megasphaera cerevisiae DSM 20462]
MDIKKTVIKLCRKHKTTDPFKIAADLDIIVIFEDLGLALGYFDSQYRIKPSTLTPWYRTN